MNETKDDLIQWPKAKYWTKAWNPIIGCKPCSPACEHCYAAEWAKRFHKSFAPHASSHERPPRKGVVFCGNMTDLFGEWVEGPWLQFIYRVNRLVISGASSATYLWLTKRTEIMTEQLMMYGDAPHSYFGFTAENQEYFLRRGLACADMPEWANLWVSVEPMLGPVDLLALPSGIRERIKWVVVGCESGPNRRPCKLKWIEDVVYQCIYPHHSIPVFVKQLDINGKCERDITKFPATLQIRQVPWANKGEMK